MKRHHIVKRVKSEVRKNLACAEYLLLEMGIHTEARRPESLSNRHAMVVNSRRAQVKSAPAARRLMR